MEFAEDLKPGTWYSKKETYNKYIESYPDYSKILKQQTFAKWIRLYAKLNGLKYEHQKSGTDRNFILINLLYDQDVNFSGLNKSEDII